jgi:hypothetical protein
MNVRRYLREKGQTESPHVRASTRTRTHSLRSTHKPQQASGFNPSAGDFVPGGFAPAAPAAPAAETKEETWESAPNVVAKEEAAVAPAAQVSMMYVWVWMGACSCESV